MTSLLDHFPRRFPSSSLLHLPSLFLLVALGYAAFQFADFARQIIAYPYPVDYGEGPLLSQVGRLAAFENIYRSDLAQAPYTITNYPPLYMLLQAPLHRLFGAAFWYGRALSLLGMLLAALFLGLTVQRLSGDRLAGLVGGLLLLSIPYVRTWAPLFRIDPLALGLSWAGLYAAVRVVQGRREPGKASLAQGDGVRVQAEAAGQAGAQAQAEGKRTVGAGEAAAQGDGVRVQAEAAGKAGARLAGKMSLGTLEAGASEKDVHAARTGSARLRTTWQASRRLLPAALLLTAAIFTRQSYALAAPLAAFAWLLGCQPRRRAFQLAAWAGGLSLALFLLLELLTGGGFSFNAVTANLNKFQLPTLLRYAGLVLADLPLLLALGALFLGLGWRRNRAWLLAGPYLLGAALSALTIGKIGSNVNYLLELSAALCLAAGLGLAWLRRRLAQAEGRSARTGWFLAALALTLLLAGQATWAAHQAGGYQGYLLGKTQQRTLNELLLKLIAQAPGPTLTGEHMGLLALSGRPIYYQPFEMKQLSDSGVWDQSAFLRELESGKYPLILMFRPPVGEVHARRWTPEMLAVIQQHYRNVNNFEHTIVYEWKK